MISMIIQRSPGHDSQWQNTYSDDKESHLILAKGNDAEHPIAETTIVNLARNSPAATATYFAKNHKTVFTELTGENRKAYEIWKDSRQNWHVKSFVADTYGTGVKGTELDVQQNTQIEIDRKFGGMLLKSQDGNAAVGIDANFVSVEVGLKNPPSLEGYNMRNVHHDSSAQTNRSFHPAARQTQTASQKILGDKSVNVSLRLEQDDCTGNFNIHATATTDAVKRQLKDGELRIQKKVNGQWDETGIPIHGGGKDSPQQPKLAYPFYGLTALAEAENLRAGEYRLVYTVHPNDGSKTTYTITTDSVRVPDAK